MSGRSSGSGRGSVSSKAGSQSGSQSGSRAGSRAGSPTRSPGKPSGPQKGTGLDLARDGRPLTAAELLSKRVDLPADAFKTGIEETRFTARPSYSTEGKSIKMQLNIFPVVTWPDTEVYQYDISVNPNLKDSHALVKKVWNTKTVTEALAKQGGMWLYDGHKLAWSSKKIDRNETRITVDLDSLKEKAGHEDIVKKVARQSVYYLSIRQTNVIRLSYLKAYLQGKVSWDTHVLECINFFDHCLRQYPSEQWLTIKRNFYDPEFPGGHLGTDLMTNQGIYVAPRLSESINRGGTGLAINVDRCQTAFWPGNRSLDRLALEICQGQKEEWKRWDQHKLQFNLRHKEEKIKDTDQWKIVPSEAFAFLRRFAKLKFTVNHRGKIGRPRIYTVKGLVFNAKDGLDGTNAKSVTFEKKLEDGSKRVISVYDHYKERWGFDLQYWRLPIIETPQGHLFPMELCNTVPDQRYHFKLNPKQTGDMIKLAATRPPKRTEDIKEGVKYLKWSEDSYLKAFGIKINANMMVSDAKLLSNPEVAFANAKINPGVSGRWDLRGKKFLEPNAFPLKSWAFIACGDGQTCSKHELEHFAHQFSNVYRNHGGRIEKPAFCECIPFSVGDYSKICEKAYNDTGTFTKDYPQLIFFVLPTKNQLVYERIKKNMDCRFTIVSQCLQGGHVQRCQAQYLSNVAMKVNSKLGGVTCKVPNPKSGSPPFWTRPTAMIGVDVSHASPGSSQPSMAALTMSMDKHATRFAAACQTNHWRRETIEAPVMHSMLPKLANHWATVNKTMPQHVYYLRDGVSEGQFQAVLDEEVSEMKRIFRELGGGIPKFTVVIATKRHHVRFLPKDKKDCDRNGNPLPGTLVERDVTHPQHFDFYLCSHVAIQGTARPVHYQVILDEAGVKPNDLVKMIYQQCYQYCRSTTPVSLHPAVYYAHLASNRARSHEDLSAGDIIMAYGKPGFPYIKDDSDIYPGRRPLQTPALLRMENDKVPKQLVSFMNTTMWYV
ncbi:Piwi-domain-containing protein [Hypoxylon sp. FL0890]|nr:Piwi-domain-containing protein [Hypoxylon sp. FL0890]